MARVIRFPDSSEESEKFKIEIPHSKEYSDAARELIDFIDRQPLDRRDCFLLVHLIISYTGAGMNDAMQFGIRPVYEYHKELESETKKEEPNKGP